MNKKKEQQENAKKNIYTHGFPKNFSEDDLKKLFSQHGRVKSAYINKDENGASKQNGVVTFETIEEANIAKKALQGHKIGQSTLFVNELMTKDQRKWLLEKQYKRQNLFVQNIPEEIIDDHQLFDFFNGLEESKGKVKNAKILTKTIKDANGVEQKRGTGVGFVSFETQISATQVSKKKPSELEFFGNCLVVDFYKTKQERQQEKDKSEEKEEVKNINNIDVQSLFE